MPGFREQDHRAAMQAMLRRLPYLGANGSMRDLMIALPLIEPLLDGVRYFRVEDQPKTPGNRFHVGKTSRQKRTSRNKPAESIKYTF